MTPKTIRDRVRGKEGGFTLVELMVVVMIIAILMAIAIPTFLNSRKRAQDSSAKSNVRTALSAASAVHSEDQSYVTATFMSDLEDEEPSLVFVQDAALSATSKTISVKATNADTIFLVSKSDSGRCWALRHSLVSGADAGTSQAELGTTCSGNAAAADGVVYESIGTPRATTPPPE